MSNSFTVLMAVDFQNDPIRFGYDEGRGFISNLTANGQHYIPIVDSAIYVPNPENASDAYVPLRESVSLLTPLVTLSSTMETVPTLSCSILMDRYILETFGLDIQYFQTGFRGVAPMSGGSTR